MDEGTMCLAQSPTPGIGSEDIGICLDDGEPVVNPVESAMKRIFDSVDAIPQLRDAGVAIRFPGGEPLLLRDSDHKSGLDTYVMAEVSAADTRTWWERWNGVVLNCGGATLSWGSVVLSSAAELPSAGASTPLVVLTYSAAMATSAQCGLAIAKETSTGFQEFVKGPNGKVVDVADIVLDVISLAGGIAAAANVVRSGSALLSTSKYAAELEQLPKGQLLKQLDRLEKAQKDVGYLRELFDRTIQLEKVADPAARKLSSNLLKRALPLITSQLKNELIRGLSDTISSAMSTASSYYGGVGIRNLGALRLIRILIYQEPINNVQQK
jgi:hypothetical protein